MRRPDIDRFERYYDGEHPLLFATSKFREAFGDLFSAFADNWCDLVVDAAVERERVEGFRLGSDKQGDDTAWALWQANGLDAESTILHTDRRKCGECTVLIEPPDGDEAPRITVEHPAETIVAHDPAVPRRRLSGLKKWLSEDGSELFANVYLADAVYKFRKSNAAGGDSVLGRLREEGLWMPAGAIASQSSSWELVDVVEHALGEVPMVTFRNRAGRRGGRRAGRSDLIGVIPVQNFINKIFVDATVGSEYAAFPQRYATGIEPHLDDDGNELPHPQFVAAVSRLWVASNDDAKFGALPTIDPKVFVALIEMGVQHVAAQTRTPPHYLLGQSGRFPSGESLKSTETGLVARVRRGTSDAGEDWEDVMRIAFKAAGDRERGGQQRMETIWSDPESRTEGERVDALVKMRTLGVPEEALWEKWGASQEEIKRWRTMRADEQAAGLLGALNFEPNGPNPPAPAREETGAGV